MLLGYRMILAAVLREECPALGADARPSPRFGQNLGTASKLGRARSCPGLSAGCATSQGTHGMTQAVQSLFPFSQRPRGAWEHVVLAGKETKGSNTVCGPGQGAPGSCTAGEGECEAALSQKCELNLPKVLFFFLSVPELLLEMFIF